MERTAAVSTVLTEYVERHEVSARVEVVGAPVLHSRLGGDMTPSSAHLTYTKVGAGRWLVRARVYGRPVRGAGLLNTWEDFRGDPDGWPVWLCGVADQRHPERPGGWPGTDPEGSYL